MLLPTLNSIPSPLAINFQTERYLLAQKHNLQFFRGDPLYQATKRHSNNS